MLRLSFVVCLVCLFFAACGCFPAPDKTTKATAKAEPILEVIPAEVLEESNPKPKRRRRMYTIEILKTSGQQPYYWRVKSSNGQILLTSEKYLDNPFRTVENFTKVFQRGTVKVEDLTK